MSKYRIEVFYRTGSTFGHEDERATLCYSWNNLEIAKKNIQRIKRHHEWYENKHRSYWYGEEKKNIRKPKFVDKKWESALKLLNDDGTETDLVSASWVGHFETLYYAKIIEEEDPELIYRTEEGKYRD